MQSLSLLVNSEICAEKLNMVGGVRTRLPLMLCVAYPLLSLSGLHCLIVPDAVMMEFSSMVLRVVRSDIMLTPHSHFLSHFCWRVCCALPGGVGWSDLRNHGITNTTSNFRSFLGVYISARPAGAQGFFIFSPLQVNQRSRFRAVYSKCCCIPFGVFVRGRRSRHLDWDGHYKALSTQRDVS